MNAEQVLQDIFMHAVTLVVIAFAGLNIRRSYLRSRADFEQMLIAEGSLPVIREIMNCREIISAWCSTDLSSREVVLEVRNIGKLLNDRERTRFLANVCGEEVALFVQGPVIKLKVINPRTKKSIQDALLLTMGRRMCKDLNFYPRLDFMD